MLRPALLVVLAFPACAQPSPADSATDPLCGCPRLSLPAAPITDEAGLGELLATVQAALYPDEDGALVGVGAVKDLQFFRAWTEVETVADPPYERSYTIQYDPVVLADPPEAAAVAAILAHELGHVQDYLGMEGEIGRAHV